MHRYALLCLMLACAGPAATKRPFNRSCMDDYGRDHCDPKQRAEIERAFQIAPAEALAEQGWSGVRVFLVDGYSNDMPLITVLRRAGVPPQLEVRGPKRGFRTLKAAAGPELDAAARRLLELTAASPRFEPEKPQVEVDENGVPQYSICLHAWVGYIEAIEHGRITRRIRNACQEEPLFDQAYQLSTLVLAPFPECGILRAENYRNDSERLDACLQLGGEDLQAAAEVRNRFNAINPWKPETLRDVLAANALLLQPENPPLAGADAIVAWLSSKTSEQAEGRVTDMESTQGKGGGRHVAHHPLGTEARSAPTARVRARIIERSETQGHFATSIAGTLLRTALRRQSASSCRLVATGVAPVPAHLTPRPGNSSEGPLPMAHGTNLSDS